MTMNDDTPQQPPKPETDELQGVLRDSVEQVRSEPVPQESTLRILAKVPRSIKAAKAARRRRVLFALAGCAALLLAATSYSVVHLWQPDRPVAVTPEGWL